MRYKELFFGAVILITATVLFGGYVHRCTAWLDQFASPETVRQYMQSGEYQRQAVQWRERVYNQSQQVR